MKLFRPNLIDLTSYCVRTDIKPHRAIPKEELSKMFAIAQEHSPQIHALISLLFVGALRIQDAVGLTFEQVTKLKPSKGNVRVLKLVAKKTQAREV